MYEDAHLDADFEDRMTELYELDQRNMDSPEDFFDVCDDCGRYDDECECDDVEVGRSIYQL